MSAILNLSGTTYKIFHRKNNSTHFPQRCQLKAKGESDTPGFVISLYRSNQKWQVLEEIIKGDFMKKITFRSISLGLGLWILFILANAIQSFALPVNLPQLTIPKGGSVNSPTFVVSDTGSFTI